MHGCKKLYKLRTVAYERNETGQKNMQLQFKTALTNFWKAIVDSFHSRDKRHVYETIFIRKSYILERCD